MSRAAVSEKLGTPDVRLTGHDDLGPWTAYGWRGLKVTFRAGRVTQLESFTRRDRTARASASARRRPRCSARRQGVARRRGPRHRLND